MRTRLLLSIPFVAALGLAARREMPQPLGAAGEQAYSVQLHVHGSFSEGMGSIDSHTAESKRAGVDVLWWSDHDWRIEAYRHCSRFSFDSFSERIDRLEPWTANTTSDQRVTKELRHSRSGALDSFSAAIDPARAVEGSGSLRLSALSTRTIFQDFEYTLFANRSRFLRPLAAQVTLEVAVFPDLVGPDALPYLEVQLSLHPDPAVGPRKRYRIRYEFTPNGGPRSRSREVYVVPVAVTAGEWNRLALPITQDAELGFAPFDGEDNLLHDVYFGVQTRKGAASRSFFDDFRLSELVPPRERFEVETAMLLAKEAAVPEVAQIQGTEISYIGEHLNEFSLDPRLPDYEALFQASGQLGAGGMITNPTTMANFVARRIVAAVHARGGVVSYNHVFGTTTSTNAGPTKEKALAKLLANDLYGADLLEVGYRARGRPLLDHLWVWDRLGLAGRFVVGTGVSDSHSGFPGEYNGAGNTFVSWIWAPSRAAADLLDGLAHGRVFFGDIARFDGTLDLTTTSGFRMGDVAVTGAASEVVTLAATGLASGDRVRWIVSGAVHAVALASGPTLVESRTIPLDPSGPTIVRVEVYSGGGHEKAFSNPISFVRAAPLEPMTRLEFDRRR